MLEIILRADLEEIDMMLSGLFIALVTGHS